MSNLLDRDPAASISPEPRRSTALHTLGRVIHAHARWFVAVWAVLIALGFGAALGGFGNQGLFERLQAGDAPQVPGESRTGVDLLNRSSTSGRSVVLLVDGVDPASGAVKASLAQVRTQVTRIPHVKDVLDPYLPPVTPSPFVSADGRAVMVNVDLQPGLDAATRNDTIALVSAELTKAGDALVAQVPGSSAKVGGIQQLVDEINGHVKEDLRIGEAVALPLSLLVMILVFGGLLAAGLPIVGAIASIGGGLAVLLGFSYVVDLDASVPSVVSVLGLGLCIDYGLLLVSRYREELRRLHALAPDASATPSEESLEGALEHTLGTAGRTVLFSGITVAISLSGLMLFRATILRAIGAAGVSVVVVALLVALTLVPALLAMSGDRLIRPGVTHRIPGLRIIARRLGDVAPAEGAFSRMAVRVQRRPLLVVLGCLAVLVALALPALSIRIVNSGVSMLPTSSVQRQVFDTMGARFPATQQAPLLVVSRADAATLTAYGAQVAKLPGVKSVDPVKVQGTGANAVSVLGVRPVSDAKSAQAREVVDEVRANRPSFEIWVTGESAQVADFLGDIRARAPLAIGIVVLATFVLLFLMTGSVLIPLKALVMNTVSLGASFGILVWVFQEGHFESFLRFTSNGGIDQTIPAIVLAFAFGLSMDYEVFLLSRIKELRDGGADNDAAVRIGLQRSGRIITSAALIVVIVFAGFVAGQLLIIKQMGVALAVAVLVDATLVRMLLVPATMTLLGEWNWWAPEPLRRLHERFGLREGEDDLAVEASYLER